MQAGSLVMRMLAGGGRASWRAHRLAVGAYFCALLTLHAVSGASQLHLAKNYDNAGPSEELPLPWVFMFQSDSDETHTDVMKAAVLSWIAYSEGSLIPFCMYRGSERTDTYKWLVEQGVTMIHHTPTWQGQFWNDVEAWSNRQENPERPLASTKLGGKDTILGTFMRVDVPILEELKDFKYALYTDTDIYFRGPVRMKDIGFYPETIAMGRPTFSTSVHAKENSNAGMHQHALRQRKCTCSD